MEIEDVERDIKQKIVCLTENRNMISYLMGQINILTELKIQRYLEYSQSHGSTSEVKA